MTSSEAIRWDRWLSLCPWSMNLIILHFLMELYKSAVYGAVEHANGAEQV
jgi:hypothetical protein